MPAVADAKAHALISDFGRVPLFFVPNRGQMDGQVDFYVRGNDKTVFFSPDGLTLALEYSGGAREKGEPERWVVKLDFIGSREGVQPEGLEETGAVISYFSGKPEEWKTGLAAYSRIIYRDLWPGIDLAYKGELDELKYEFIVHPGADPSMIRLAYRGAEAVSLTEEGRISVKTPAGGFEDDIPIAYQEADGRRSAISVAYFLEGVPMTRSSGIAPDSGITSEDGSMNRSCVYGFEVGDYDRSQVLIIDPAVLVYCGYIGGAGEDSSFGIACDASRNIYVTGYSYSGESTFPVNAGPDLTQNGDMDAFVAKVDSSGTSLIYCGYIGGSGEDVGCGIAVDASGNAYISGSTHSSETTFPVTVGPDLTYNGGDSFVAKVNSSGTALVYCGYIGPTSWDWSYSWSVDIAVDSVGFAYVTGTTGSSESAFPVKGGPDLTYNGGADAYVAKVNSAGSDLIFCGYVGGSGRERSSGIDIDESGNVYIVGWTNSSESTFPVNVGPDLTYNGGSGFFGDFYVAKVDSSGSDLVYCGYIGGSGNELDGPWVAVGDSGHAYIAGMTQSTESTFPVKAGPDLTYNGSTDGFVAKVNSSGTGLDYCGYIGGSEDDLCTGIALDASGNAYVSGHTHSTETTFPVTDGPDLSHNGNLDAFAAKINASGTALLYCGYIGGAGDDGTGYCGGGTITIDVMGNAYIVGSTSSNESSFPVLGGPDLSHNGLSDIFVAMVGDVPGPPITSLLPDSADAGDPGFLLSVIGSDFVNGAVVRWDGSERPTTFMSISELQAQIAAADLAAGKTVQVTVRNPDGGISNALPFIIDNPLPTLTSLSTTAVTGGGAAFTLTVQGSSFVPNSVVRWNGSDRATTYVSATELQAAITTTDIATGGTAQVTVFNPAPAGGASGALAIEVSSFVLSSSPTSVTVTAGQSATYTITLTPQHGSFDSAVTFSCAGLPTKCSATFSPASATPGAAAVTTTLTLTTSASSSAAGASFFGTIGFEPPLTGILAITLLLLVSSNIRRPLPWCLCCRRLAACTLFCLVVLMASCGAGGDGNDPPPYTGTPKGTHTISVQGTSGNMTVPTSITLVVN